MHVDAERTHIGSVAFAGSVIGRVVPGQVVIGSGRRPPRLSATAEASSSDPAKLWSRSGLIRTQFALPVDVAARAYLMERNRTLWDGLPDGVSVRDVEDNDRQFST